MRPAFSWSLVRSVVEQVEGEALREEGATDVVVEAVEGAVRFTALLGVETAEKDTELRTLPFADALDDGRAPAGGSASRCLDRKQILGDIFIKMDVDSSRSVNLKEYRALFPSGSKAKAMQWVFKYLDELENGGDFNGELSRDEWVNGMLEFGRDDSDDDWKAEMDGYVKALEEARRAWLKRP